MNWRALLRDFRAHWSPKRIAERMDDWTHDFRAAIGSDPDPKVEQRRADRTRRKDHP